jgi:protein O-mannosyl-transferase
VLQLVYNLDVDGHAVIGCDVNLHNLLRSRFLMCVSLLIHYRTPVKGFFGEWTSPGGFSTLRRTKFNGLPQESTSSFMPQEPRRTWSLIVGALVIFALVLLVYRPVLPGSFVMDDRRLIEGENPLVTGEMTPWNIWFQADFALSTFVFWRQWLAWGPNPGWYHATNMLLHALSAVLLWRVLARLKVPGAWVAGALFAVHPVCVNSVARISELKNTLSLPFFLLSLWLYVPELEPAATRCARDSAHYIFSLVAFVLALFAKTSTIMLPVVLLAGAAWKNGRITARDVLRTVPFFVLSLAFGVMSIWFQKHQAMVGATLAPESMWVRLAAAGDVFWFYLGKALWPAHLNLVYPEWKINPASALAYIPALLFLFVVIVCWRFRRGWGRHVLFGLGVYAITLFPALGFFDSQFLTHWRVSDHLQYLPLIAPVSLAVALVAAVLPRWLGSGVAIIVIAAWCLLTFHRARVFSSEENLYKDTLAKNPAAWGTQIDYGVVLASRGDFAAAMEHFKASLRYHADNPDAESNLGQALAEQGKSDEAETHYLAALKSRPNDAEAHRRLAIALVKQGQIPEALYHFRQAITLSRKPEIKTRLTYADLLHQTGDFKESATQLRRIIALKPDSVEALNNLAWILATAPDDAVRDGAAAVEYAQRAAKLPPVPGLCVPGTLAAAYAEAGRFPDAITTAENAIQTETAEGQTRFASINQQLLTLYRAGKPFHEPRRNNQ